MLEALSIYQNHLCTACVLFCAYVIPRQSVLLWTTDVHPVGEQRYKFVCTDNTINVKIAIDAETMSRYQSRITLQHIRTAIYWACSGRIFLQQN